jgi:hypothetical protein
MGADLLVLRSDGSYGYVIKDMGGRIDDWATLPAIAGFGILFSIIEPC